MCTISLVYSCRNMDIYIATACRFGDFGGKLDYRCWRMSLSSLGDASMNVHQKLLLASVQHSHLMFPLETWEILKVLHPFVGVKRSILFSSLNLKSMCLCNLKFQKNNRLQSHFS